jgi:NADH:ubiquinone oxidoreductase subunit 2 (subunit N)
MQNLQFLIPEMVIGGFGLLILLADLLLGPKRGRLLYFGAIAAVVATVAAVVGLSMKGMTGEGTLWVIDPAGTLMKCAILVTTFLSLLLSLGYGKLPARHLGMFAALLLWAVAGLMVMVSAVDWLLIFLAIELVSIASFVLAGFERESLKSSEGAMKYFIIGAFSSALTLYGLSLAPPARPTSSPPRP